MPKLLGPRPAPAARSLALCLALWLALAPIIAARTAAASESGFSHSIVGALATPGAGIVPPEPGVYWLSSQAYYAASARGSVPFPVAGRLQLGLDVELFSSTFGAIYVPRANLGPFTLGFGISIPVSYVRGEVQAAGRSRSESNTSLGDIVVTPLMLGYRSGSHFVSGRLDIFTPTGAYEAGALNNVGLNYWTFTPTVAYTYLRPGVLDVSATAGVDINTRNPKTDYTSGAVFHLDTAVTFDVGGGFGIGALGSVLYQFTDDRGGLARQLNGFRGRSFSVGPLARYAFKLGETQINATLAWAPEFGVRNRVEGGGIFLTLSGRF